MTRLDPRHPPPSALERLPEIVERLRHRDPAFFLDFDGTLAPIAARPSLARMPDPTRALLSRLAERHLVCILSGRELSDLRAKVGVPAAYYGADHGRHIIGPQGSDAEHVVGAEAREDLRAAGRLLQRALADIDGVIVEKKDLSLSVHFRQTPARERATVTSRVEEIAGSYPMLTLGHGRSVFEIRPRDGWDKGQAMLWLLGRLAIAPSQTCAICMGDDLTDEDMFRSLGDEDVTVVVGDATRPTLARFTVADPEEAARFLASLSVALGPRREAHD